MAAKRLPGWAGFLLLVFCGGVARADFSITAASLNGRSTAVVVGNDSVSAVLTLDYFGNTSGSNGRWYATELTLAGSKTCVDHANQSSPGPDSTSFFITAPAIPGLYDLSLQAYSSDNCSGQSSALYTLPAGIQVLPPAAADYRMDECAWEGVAGEVKDASGNGRHGQALNGASTDNTTPFGSSRQDRYGVFTPAGRLVQVPYSASLNPAGGFTASLWARVDGGQGSWRSPLTSRDHTSSTYHGYNIYAGTDNRWQFWTGGNGGWHTLAGGAVTLGAWTHVAIRFTVTGDPTANGDYPGTMTLFINGAAVATKTNAYYRPNRSQALMLGAGGDGSASPTFFFNGLIDEVKVFASDLSDAQVQSIYSQEQAAKNWDGAARGLVNCIRPAVQAGRVTLNNTLVTPQFTRVCFDRAFSATPRVFSLPTNEGSDPASLRIRNVTPTGFEITQVEPGNLDGRHEAQTVDFLAITPGSFVLDDGSRLEVGSIDTTAYQSKLLSGSSWASVSFANSYSAPPAVLAMIQSMRNETGNPPQTPTTPWLVTAMRNVTGSGMQLALERSESTAGSITQAETIAYLVVDAGRSGPLTSSVNFESIRSTDSIQGWSNGCYTSNFLSTYAATPLAIATQNTRDGSDGGWLRRCSLSTSRVGLTVDEDTTTDTDRSHTSERAGILVLSGTFGSHLCPTTSTPPAAFNAVDVSAPAVTGKIGTKTAGSSFSLDIHALNSARTAADTAATGDVLVDLLANAAPGVALDANNCPITATSLSVGTATLNAGKANVAIGGISNAWRDVRVRMRYPATGTATVTACSTDNFAVKPAQLVAVASHADWQSAGSGASLSNTGTTGGEIHKAGRPFTLRVTGFNSTGAVTANYNGSPTASSTCVLPASGCLAGTLSVGSFSASGGASSSNTASYSEVGAISATFTDSAYAGVDSGDTPATCAGYYACSAAITIGRFVPDRLDVAWNTPAFRTACGGFTYLGQPFDYATAPLLTVTARNAAGATTLNYTGNLFKLTGASVTGQAYSAASGSLEAVAGSLPGPTITPLGAGVGSIAFGVGDAASGGGLRFARGNSPLAPFDADLALAFSLADTDNVTPAANPVLLGTATAGNGIAFNAGKTQRFGRLRLANATGSELRPLPMPLTAQYWNGQGFITNTADNCTAIPALTAVAQTSPLSPGLTFYAQSADNQLAAGETLASLISPLVSGSAGLSLSAPGAGNHGFLDLVADAPAWLEYNWDGVDQGSDGRLLDDNPRARAAFGKRRGSDRVIIRREIY